MVKVNTEVLHNEQNKVEDPIYETAHEVGEHNVEIMGMDLHNSVFLFSATLIALFVTLTLIFPDVAKQWFDATKGWSINHFDWLFMIGGNLFVLFCLALVILPVGKIRLGGADAKPSFSVLSWFAMLFSAGMGIGLMFWSVAEPVGYFTNWYGTPLNTPEGTAEAARMAMGATMFHWGLHPWAIYAVVGLSLAFFTYNCNMPLTIRSTFFPILGERVWGWPGNIIDTTAVLATIFGLATSLGFGAQQAAGGLHFLFDVPNTITTQIAIIFAVTFIAILSVVRGLEGGVKVLSNINMSLALILMLFVIFTGSTTLIINGVGTTLLAYAENIIPLSNWVNRQDTTFYHGWTIFYWAWWISWSPFVGMFIARISRGRTVREFILAVLFVPTLLTTVWMATFGGMGLEQAKNGVGQLANGISDSSLALFQMLENLPLATVTSFLAILLVLIFFITSSDSGSLVIDSITAGGKVDVPVVQRVFWATLEGVIAAVLLFGGGADALGALQAAAITVGLPFTVILIVMCVSLFLGLRKEHRVLKNN
ncbi:BCCT family transporter [Psychrobium sp. 1_MG-2023]|uniref:BCCT family transporter n=1 Tax=Psychrobium sp. 1_MG-2023 TaxID=3062624 RepID=UPI000C33ACA7|nr:BCCT family transporter [Psychrobium sp. 1_MG-2023]MDP2562647.1 BCCT family transporter [Psychrobium sp. 1_MG-2023]PKF53823.1 glycine/betaine ABC transporter [Alteromonadales bacterium alter-6D02]